MLLDQEDVESLQKAFTDDWTMAVFVMGQSQVAECTGEWGCDDEGPYWDPSSWAWVRPRPEMANYGWKQASPIVSPYVSEDEGWPGQGNDDDWSNWDDWSSWGDWSPGWNQGGKASWTWEEWREPGQGYRRYREEWEEPGKGKARAWLGDDEEDHYDPQATSSTGGKAAPMDRWVTRGKRADWRRLQKRRLERAGEPVPDWIKPQPVRVEDIKSLKKAFWELNQKGKQLKQQGREYEASKAKEAPPPRPHNFPPTTPWWTPQNATQPDQPAQGNATQPDQPADGTAATPGNNCDSRPMGRGTPAQPEQGSLEKRSRSRTEEPQRGADANASVPPPGTPIVGAEVKQEPEQGNEGTAAEPEEGIETDEDDDDDDKKDKKEKKKKKKKTKRDPSKKKKKKKIKMRAMIKMRAKKRRRKMMRARGLKLEAIGQSLHKAKQHWQSLHKANHGWVQTPAKGPVQKAIAILGTSPGPRTKGFCKKRAEISRVVWEKKTGQT